VARVPETKRIQSRVCPLPMGLRKSPLSWVEHEKRRLYGHQRTGLGSSPLTVGKLGGPTYKSSSSSRHLLQLVRIVLGGFLFGAIFQVCTNNMTDVKIKARRINWTGCEKLKESQILGGLKRGKLSWMEGRCWEKTKKVLRQT